MEVPQQGFNLPQQHFNQYNSYNGSINPSGLAMGGWNGIATKNSGYGSSSQNINAQVLNPSANFSTLGDDELLDSLSNGQDFPQNLHTGQNGAAAVFVDLNHINGYFNPLDRDPIQSPFLHNAKHIQFRHMPQHDFGNSLHLPDTGNISRDTSNYAKQGPWLSTVVQGRKSSVFPPLHIGSVENSNFPIEPIHMPHSHEHQKTLPGQLDQTTSSLNSFGGSDFSPIQDIHPNLVVSDILKGTSMPTKLNTGHKAGIAPALQSQEMKRRRRRESHNLVERRRRDNINERIQELSHLVPMHRLEDEKVRQVLQNNSQLLPTLAGLARPGRAVSNITTGIQIEEKDKSPNKGDILNGTVGWTRDLMWMLHLKLQHQEDLGNIIAKLGGTFPFEETEDEKRMRTELVDAILKNDGEKFQYSRAPGSGLRVPKHTDVKGDAIGSSAQGGQIDTSLSPDYHNTGTPG
jgi:hypothetical protein